MRSCIIHMLLDKHSLVWPGKFFVVSMHAEISYVSLNDLLCVFVMRSLFLFLNLRQSPALTFLCESDYMSCTIIVSWWWFQTWNREIIDLVRKILERKRFFNLKQQRADGSWSSLRFFLTWWNSNGMEWLHFINSFSPRLRLTLL